MSTLSEQIEAVRAVVGELSGNPGNWYLDKLRDVLATLEGLAAPGETPPDPCQRQGCGPHFCRGDADCPRDAPDPQQPTPEARPYQADARRVAAEVLAAHDDSADPDMDKLELAFSHALEGFAAQRVTAPQQPSEASEDAFRRAHRLWYTRFDGKEKSPGLIITAYAEEITVATVEAREKVAEFMLRNSIATGHGDTIDDLLKALQAHLPAAPISGDARERARRIVNEGGPLPSPWRIVGSLDIATDVIAAALAAAAAKARREAERAPPDIVAALRRHIDSDMDQFDLWRLKDAYNNTVYVSLSYYPGDRPPDSYDDLDAPPPTPQNPGEAEPESE